MSYRNRTGLCGLLIGCSVAVASACGGLDSVKVIVTPEDGGTGNPSGGKSGGGGKPNGGDTSAGATGEDAGAGGAAAGPGSAGSAGEEASGGEGGQITIPDPMPGPPTVLTVLPKDGLTDADPFGLIRIGFSEPLDAATVTDVSVQLKDEAGAVVNGTVTYADAVATFKPSRRLNLLGKYSVNVSTAVTDVDKTAMERPFTSFFNVRDGVWGKAEAPLTESTAPFDPSSYVSLATDGVGRVTAVWSQATDGGTTLDIYAALFQQGKGWAAPFKVNTNVAKCQYPNVAMNASGNAIVGWTEYDATLGYSVQTRRIVDGVWDKTSFKVDMPATAPLTTYPSGVTVALTATGDAHVSWLHYIYDSAAGVNYYGVYGRHANPAGTWDLSLTTFVYKIGSGVSQPSLAFDGAGNGFLAYQFSSGSPITSNTFVFRYAAATSKWGTSAIDAKLATSEGYDLPVSVATNPAGEAVLAWGRGTVIDAANTSYDLVGSYFNKVWTLPAVISSATTTISSSRTMASATWTGASFWVAWGQSAGTLFNVYVNEYKASWGRPAIVSDGVHNAALPWLSADSRGNALVVWIQASDDAGSPINSDIGFSRFVGATAKWSDTARASRAIAGYRAPQVVTLADGVSIAAWQRWTRPTIKTISVTGVLQNDFQ